LVHDVSSSAYSKLLGFTELGDLADMFGVIELSFMLLVGLAPQIEPSTSEAVLLGNFTHAGGLQLSELGLGSGGVLSKRAKVQQAALNHASGRAETVGGVRVNAQKEGVKLTFVSGRELLITPSACIHLRSGEHTLAFFGGVRLCLADGSVVTVKRGTSPKRPLTSVVVEDRGRVRRIWSGSRRVVHGSYSKAFQGSTLLVLGDGGSLYRANAAGPVVALSRVLCPADQVNNVPARRLVIVGDVLARSLQLLPKHAPRKSVQFPQVEEAAQRFAALAPLFHQNVARVPGSVGELWFALADQYRLKVSTAERAILKIGLYRGSSLIPGVEWIVASRTTIHFVRPDGGASGGPRYFMRGIDLRGILSGSLPLTDSVASRFRVSEAVSAMGGRQPKSLQVRVASRARRNP
jgi:hypothetical protein